MALGGPQSSKGKMDGLDSTFILISINLTLLQTFTVPTSKTMPTFHSLSPFFVLFFTALEQGSPQKEEYNPGPSALSS